MNTRLYHIFTAISLFIYSRLIFAVDVTSSTSAALAISSEQTPYGITDVVSFNPSPGDVSMVFLGNIFGSVDGVLAGSGSQIIGEMFGVFNSAVLTLGGIILFYILLRSTMNTAHQGQMLGQKWSTIWVPFRSILGVGLLLPKASGYCTMQVFVMWVIVQGVGAADAVWSAALNYLNRGGVIIQQQMSPAASAGGDGGKIMDGAMGMLVSQVCMQALDLSIIKVQNKTKKSNICNNLSDPNSNIYKFCHDSVPNFMESVDIISSDNLSTSGGSKIKQDMPSFKSAPYNLLNGICGTLSWNQFNSKSSSGLSNSEKDAKKSSRSIAVNQMFTALIPVSTEIVNNVPLLNNFSCSKDKSDQFNSCVSDLYAKYSFGIPLTRNYTEGCTNRLSNVSPNSSSKGMPTFKDNNTYEKSDSGSGFVDKMNNAGNDMVKRQRKNNNWVDNNVSNPINNALKTDVWAKKSKPSSPRRVIFSDPSACASWGMPDQSTSILSGTELQNAVAAYNGIMLPTLSSESLSSGSKKAEYIKARAFIREAESKGWLMAGAYFYKLAILNTFTTANTGNGSLTDTRSGLNFTLKDPSSSSDSGPWSTNVMINKINNLCGTPSKTNSSLKEGATVFCNSNNQQVKYIASVIADASSTELAKKSFPAKMPTHASVFSPSASVSNDVFTYLINANSMVLPTQTTILKAGLKEANFALDVNQIVPELGTINNNSGFFGIPGAIISLFYNSILRPIFNTLLKIAMVPVVTLISMIITPMLGMTANIFNNALEVMRIPGVNPIIAIANMGTRFIDGSGNAFFGIIIYAAGAGLSPLVLGVIILFMPLIAVWLGIMMGIGMLCAYYVPFVPLLVFTFAGIGWLIGVIEGMVAAPIVALGVIHPHGQHDSLGKSEQAVNLLLSMFLRPSMMVIGYIFGIIISYVGVWFMNTGFNIYSEDLRALGKISNDNIAPALNGPSQNVLYDSKLNILLFYFLVLTYTMMYITIVQKSFDMIYYLPDKVLRWLAGGMAEQLGESAAKGMQQSVKGQASEVTQAASKAVAKVGSSMISKATQEPKKKDEDEDEDEDESGSEAGGESAGASGGAA